MAVTVYKSTDASAPVLTGLAGSLITVLDACLVNGYGTKVAAGWGKAYSGTNKAVYRAAAGARQYFRVQDDAPNTRSLGREARICGYETMTAIDTGTELFPTATQMATGLSIYKSATPDATAQSWVIVADAKTCYMFAKTLEMPGYSAFMMGEFYSLAGSGDAYRSALIARDAEQSTTTGGSNHVTTADDNLKDLCALTTNLPGHYTPRSWNHGSGLALAQAVGKHGNAAHSTSALAGICPYPNPVDNSMMLSQVWVHEFGAVAVVRGRLRGFWHFLHPAASALGDGDTWTGSGALAGKSFMAIRPTADGAGVYVMETSDTWETN